jgi:hypothetical protein
MKTLVLMAFLGPLLFSFLAIANPCNSRDTTLLMQADKYMKELSFDYALKQLYQLTASCQAERDTKKILAQAYAGEAGLNLAAMTNILKAPGTDNFYQLAVHLAADSNDGLPCRQAMESILSISSDTNQRTSDENLLLSKLALGTIGELSRGAYGALDFCSVATATDNDIRDIIVSQSHLYESSASLVDNFPSMGNYMVALENMSAMMGRPLHTTVQFDNITAEDIKAERNLLTSQVYGQGQCTSKDVKLCCP